MDLRRVPGPERERERPSSTARLGLVRGIRARRRGAPGLFQHFLNYLDEDFLRRREPEAYEQDGVRVISAGPNAFLYVLDVTAPLDAEALEHRFPGLAEQLSQSPGVGFVLARSGDGPLCFWRGKRYQLGESEPGPFAGRADASLVVQGIADLMAMPSAGDLVIYGIDAPEGHVSFIPEVGAHAGPSPEEMHTFIVRPAKVTPAVADQSSGPALRPLHPLSGAVVSAPESLRSSSRPEAARPGSASGRSPTGWRPCWRR